MTGDKDEGSEELKPERTSHDAVFHLEFRDDLRYWVESNRRITLNALTLVEAVMREPFSGIGKPEPLRHLGPGVWSRRLTREHRIVYLVSSTVSTSFKHATTTHQWCYRSSENLLD